MPVCWIGLQVLGLARLEARLARSGSHGKSMSLAEAQETGRLVNLAARYAPVRANCLTRSLLLSWMLRRRGVACELRIGVRLVQGMFSAHAWVEVEGLPVNDRPDIATEFAPFERRRIRGLAGAAFDTA